MTAIEGLITAAIALFVVPAFVHAVYVRIQARKKAARERSFAEHAEFWRSEFERGIAEMRMERESRRAAHDHACGDV